MNTHLPGSACLCAEARLGACEELLPREPEPQGLELRTVVKGHGWERDGFRSLGHNPAGTRSSRAGSVHPADRHPLGLRPQLLHGGLELAEGPLQVAVDQAEVKVVPVAPLDAAALLHRPSQVRFLPTQGDLPPVSVPHSPPSSEGSTACPAQTPPQRPTMVNTDSLAWSPSLHVPRRSPATMDRHTGKRKEGNSP